jgi:hypothetical protein
VFDQLDSSVGRAAQKYAAVRGDGATIEGAHKLAPGAGSEGEGIGVTVFRGSSGARGKSLLHNHFRSVGALMRSPIAIKRG